MGRILKWVLGGLFSLIFLVGLVIFLLITFVDLNSLKPRIETLAKEQAEIDLRIPGDLSWSFFPYLGIELGEIQVRPLSTPNSLPLASIQKVAVGIAVTPLLKGEVQVERIHLIQPSVYLHRNAEGVANWELIQASLASKSKATEEVETDSVTASPEADTPLALNLAIADIWLDRAAVHIKDEIEQLDLQLTDVSFRAKDVSLIQAFPLELTAKLNLAEPKVSLDLNLNSHIKLDLNTQHYALNQLEIKLIAGYPELLTTPITLTLDGSIDAQMASGEVKLPLALNLSEPDWVDASLPRIAATKLALDAHLDLNKQRYLLNKLQLDSAIRLDKKQQLLPLELLVTAKADLEKQQVAVNQLDLAFDETQFKGKADINLETLAIFLRLAGDELDADRYLTPSTDDTKTATAEAEQPIKSGDEELLPVELIKALNLDIGFTFDKLKISGLTVEQIDLALTAKDGLIDLQKANLDLYQGAFRNKAQVDVRKEPAKLSLTTNLKNMNLRPLLDDLEQTSVPLRGNLNLAGDFTTQGTRLSEWMAHSNGKGSLRMLDGAVTGMNLTKEVCAAAASIDGRSSNKQWSEDTEFTSLLADINLVNGKLNNQDLKLAIPGFEVSGYGFYHLVAENFLYNLGVQFNKDADQQACPVNSTLAAIRWPVECKGSLAGELPDIKCRPDTKAVTNLVEQMLKDAAKREANKIKDQAKEDAKAKIDEQKSEIKEEAKKQIRSLFK